MPCYRGNETKPLFPNTVQVLVELIRKIENANPLSNIRIISATLLHKLRVDGIERTNGVKETKYVTPFGASGIMAAKFKLILQMVSNVATNLELLRVLNRNELCHLHQMLSVTVEPWERGDENKVCSMQQIPWKTEAKFDHHYSVRPIE